MDCIIRQVNSSIRFARFVSNHNFLLFFDSRLLSESCLSLQQSWTSLLCTVYHSRLQTCSHLHLPSHCVLFCSAHGYPYTYFGRITVACNGKLHVPDRIVVTVGWLHTVTSNSLIPSRTASPTNSLFKTVSFIMKSHIFLVAADTVNTHNEGGTNISPSQHDERRAELHRRL